MQVLLLMSTALNVSIPEPPTLREPHMRLGDALPTELRARQQCIAEVTEMIHVSLYFCLSITIGFCYNVHYILPLDFITVYTTFYQNNLC